MLPFEENITIKTKDPVNGESTTTYENIEADVQINNKGNDGGDNSDHSEIADYFVFVRKEITNLKIGDSIYYTDDFGDDVILEIISRDFIDFVGQERFVEILCKKK